MIQRTLFSKSQLQLMLDVTGYLTQLFTTPADPHALITSACRRKLSIIYYEIDGKFAADICHF